MRVTKQIQKGWTLQQDPLYTIHTVGLYIIISVPSKGLTLIWDKHTRITVELHPDWRVSNKNAKKDFKRDHSCVVEYCYPHYKA